MLNLAYSCRILQNFAEYCRIFQIFSEICKTSQNLAKSAVLHSPVFSFALSCLCSLLDWFFQSTARWVEFKWNWVNFSRDLCGVKDCASGLQNILCLKSWIKGHRNGQLGTLPNWPSLAVSAKLPSRPFLSPLI